MKSNMRILRSSSAVGMALFCAAFTPQAFAQSVTLPATSENIAPPATKLKTAALISPTDARSYFGAGATHTSGLSLAASSPEIIALSKALLGGRNVSVSTDRDAFAQNVADYVRNNINTEFRYGLSKGGRGALIDQSGTPFDQSELMALLLRQQGVAVSIVTGDATLTADQFGKWTGLVQSLNEGAQTFTVNALAACQMLADGGIPASVNGASSCTGLSGNVTSVVMSHIWIQVAGINYDPSFKINTLRTGIDVPAAMGCGTQAASTCGSAVSTAGMTAATQGTTSGGIPYVSGYNLGAAKTTHDALKTSLATYIKGQNINGQGINASVYDVLGGKRLDPQAGARAPLSYASAATWTGGVPDQYRTKLNVKTTGCGSFFADEIAGRALIYKRGIQFGSEGFLVDGQDIASLAYVAAGSCNAAAAPYIQIAVDHPYAASSGAYADEVVNFKPVDPPSDETGAHRRMRATYLYFEGGAGTEPQTYDSSGTSGNKATDWPEQNYLSVAPIIIVHGFGQAGMSAQKAMSDRNAVTLPPQEKCQVTSVSATPAARDCNYFEQAVVAETFASTRSLADALVDGVAKTVTTRHHDIGIIYSGRNLGLAMMSVQESMSIAPMSGLSQDRQAAFDMSSLALAEAESRSNAIDSAPGISAARAFFVKGFDTTLSGTAGKVYDIAPSQMAGYVAALPHQASVHNGDGSTSYGSYCINYLNVMGAVVASPGCWRHLALQDVANQGYSTLIMEGGLGELFYNGTSERALTMWEYVKGGATIGDGLATAMKTTELVDHAALRGKFLSVSPSSGDLAYVAGADIVTGTGEFPSSLPFSRTFTPRTKERTRGTSSYYYNNSGAFKTLDSTAAVTSGPDSQYHDRLGGGWTHNYQIRMSRTNDLTYQLGTENAFFASEFIANLQIIKDLGTSGALAAKLGSLFAINNMDRTVSGYGGGTWNTVMVMAGADPVVFHKTFDNSWISSKEPDAKLDGSLTVYTSRDGDTINFSPYRYDEALFNSTDNSLVGPVSSYANYKTFKADQWTFPSGIVLNFQYDAMPLSTPPVCTPESSPTQYHGQYGYLLRKVSNNLGRALNFDYDDQWTRQTTSEPCGPDYDQTVIHLAYGYFPVSFHSYRLKKVTDENGRFATFDLAGGDINGSYFTATDPLLQVTRYEYNAGTDSPDPVAVVRNDYQLRRWFTAANASTPYQSIRYDDLYRVSKITGRNGNFETYYPGGLYGSELWKRTELVDGVGNVSLQNFNEKNEDILSQDPLGAITLNTYDNSSRLLRTTMPVGNAVEYSYDVRGNVVRTCQIGSNRVGQPCNEALDIFTRTSYVEGATILSCVNLVTCNKPASETDARGNVTDYTWDATTGNLTRILKPSVWSPADNANVRPQTDATYTLMGGISFLTSKTEKITGTQSVATSYDYDSANHYVLRSAVVDSAGLALRTCLKFDPVGRLISSTRPKGAAGGCP